MFANSKREWKMERGSYTKTMCYSIKGISVLILSMVSEAIILQTETGIAGVLYKESFKVLAST